MDCPKCAEPMRVYERNGVTVDQCTGCRGIFLDRGELERLIDAEAAHYATPPGGSASPSSHDSEQRVSGQGGRHGSGGGRKQRRGGFLSELFD